MARVLRLSEIPDVDGAVMIEDRNANMLFWGIYRYEQKPFFRFADKDHTLGIDLQCATYGDEWRAWDERPTEEERKAASWK